MGYAVYEQRDFDRWAGYGVPAECDVLDCRNLIDRGLGYACDEHGHDCGLFYCEEHRWSITCDPEADGKPDSPQWEEHILQDESWEQWRQHNPVTTNAMRVRSQARRDHERQETR